MEILSQMKRPQESDYKDKEEFKESLAWWMKKQSYANRKIPGRTLPGKKVKND